MGHGPDRRYCMICCEPINDGDNIVRLAGNQDQIFKEDAFDAMMKFYEDRGVEDDDRVCPITNEKIDMDKIVRE